MSLFLFCFVFPLKTCYWYYPSHCKLTEQCSNLWVLNYLSVKKIYIHTSGIKAFFHEFPFIKCAVIFYNIFVGRESVCLEFLWQEGLEWMMTASLHKLQKHGHLWNVAGLKIWTERSAFQSKQRFFVLFLEERDFVRWHVRSIWTADQEKAKSVFINLLEMPGLGRPRSFWWLRTHIPHAHM